MEGSGAKRNKEVKHVGNWDKCIPDSMGTTQGWQTLRMLEEGQKVPGAE